MDWMTLDELIARLTMCRDSVNAGDLVRVDCPFTALDPLYVTDVGLGVDGRVEPAPEHHDRIGVEVRLVEAAQGVLLAELGQTGRFVVGVEGAVGAVWHAGQCTPGLRHSQGPWCTMPGGNETKESG